MAADETGFRPGDNEPVLLRKILQTLQGTGSVPAQFDVQTQQGDLDSSLDSVTVHPNSAGVTVANVALATSLVIKASPGKLLMLTAYNNNGAARFIQLFNATALPGNGAVPVMIISVPTLGTFSFPIPNLSGMDFSTGIVVANSTTAATLTVGSADSWFTAIVV